MGVPQSAQIVIAGGGIVGVSLAYHLAKLGQRDIVLLEQGSLTCGTTWHAAGLVGQMRPNRAMTRMSQYGTGLYATLEAETGLATGWKQCGSVNVARRPERWIVYQRQAAMARSFGIAVEMLSPRQALDKWPLLRIDDLQGALWFPQDGKANPADLTQSLARGARNLGVKIVQGVKVTGVKLANGALAGVTTSLGEMTCEVLANCTGQWARAFGAQAGVNVPLHSAEHFYVVTEPIAGVSRDLPAMRDPDGYIYFKEEVGGLVMGGFEPEAKPWGMDGIPEQFEFQLLPEDWDHFEILMRNAIHRVPALEHAGVKKLLNGPESFTPDGNFILGEAPEVKNYYLAAGFNSAGIANAGGAGKLLAEWIVGGESPMDLFEVDIRRFGPYASGAKWLRDRTVESLGLHYAMRWPRHEMETGRALRKSRLYERLQARGACFGSKMGWERPNWFARPGEKPEMRYTLGRPDWLDAVIEEQRAVRDAAGLFDQSSFGKLQVQGRDALRALERLCANRIDVPIGRVVYTAMLNRRGGFESDFTVQRLGAEQFLVVTGTAQPVRDASWIRRHLCVGEQVAVTDVTDQWSVLSLMGPRASEILARIEPAGFSARAVNLSYVGGAGCEIYVPVERAAALYDALWVAGRDLGLKNCGYYALDALRIEAGRRAFPSELSPDFTPWEAGLGFAVKLDKGDFIGRDALAKGRAAVLSKRLVIFNFAETELFAWGGEPILRDGTPVGEICSTGYSAALGMMVGMGYVYSEPPENLQEVLTGRYEIEVSGTRVAASAGLRAPWPRA
ncbi:MAG: FAD-dependent oxidoreductase [Betaproteobacteria bacterium]|nr:FAD-dependent oxidoreductase [Betaproteobacteria bacterium]